MKRTSPIRLFSALLFGATYLARQAGADVSPWKWQDARIPELGFDLDSAEIVRVTSLETKGPGTLRDALKKKGPRIVVFEVAGVIDLQRQSLDVNEPQLIIAAQTAPHPGITLVRGGIKIKASQVALLHLRVRPGDAGQPKGSGWEPDGITTAGTPHDVWIDHCSATWSVDENISVNSSVSPTGEVGRRIQIRNCIIAEGLNHSSHHKGPHSKGTLVLDGTQQVAIVGNLYSSNVERNPVFKLSTSGVIVNNLIANPGQRAIHASIPDEATAPLPKARISVVGNVVLFGKETKKSAAIFEGAADGFFRENEGFDWLGNPLPLLRRSFDTLAAPPVWPEGLNTISPAAVVWRVARLAGARPAERDAIDERIVREALTGTARIIDSQDEVGGYPNVEPVIRKLEVPEKNRRLWLERLAEEVEHR